MNFVPLEVIDKATGKVTTIKSNRFDARIHKYVSGDGGSVEIVSEGYVPQAGVAVVADEKEDKALKMHELRALAKEKGLTIQPTTKKAEILELLKNVV